MLILKSTDAREDARSFAAAHISDFEVFDFGREAKKPDGTTVKVAFSLAFARDPASPRPPRWRSDSRPGDRKRNSLLDRRRPR